METLSIIITLISVVAATLQIILFFKVWGMCNDIKAMRKVQAPEREIKKDEVSAIKLMCALIIAIIIVGISIFLSLE